jgi:hypothetical protein
MDVSNRRGCLNLLVHMIAVAVVAVTLELVALIQNIKAHVNAISYSNLVHHILALFQIFPKLLNGIKTLIGTYHTLCISRLTDLPD